MLKFFDLWRKGRDFPPQRRVRRRGAELTVIFYRQLLSPENIFSTRRKGRDSNSRALADHSLSKRAHSASMRPFRLKENYIFSRIRDFLTKSNILEKSGQACALNLSRLNGGCVDEAQCDPSMRTKLFVISCKLSVDVHPPQRFNSFLHRRMSHKKTRNPILRFFSFKRI